MQYGCLGRPNRCSEPAVTHLAKSMLFFREPGCTKMTEGVALVHQYSVGSWAFLALLFAYQSPRWSFAMLEGWPSSRRVLALQRVQLHLGRPKKSGWSYALGPQLYQGPEGVPDKMNLLLDGGGLVDGFAISRPGAAQSAHPGYESRLWCDTAIDYSAAFCTWKFFLGSVGTASVLKPVRLGLN